MKNPIYLISILLVTILVACTQSQGTQRAEVLPPPTSEELEELKEATFAGGCFWCTEAVFERTEGVRDVVSGYSGGDQKNPTYKQVSYGETDHAECVNIYYDPEVITYQELLEIFFATHNPTQLNRQGPDVGKQYRSAVFYRTEEEKKMTEAYIQKLDKSGKYDEPIVTEVSKLKIFYEAEDYHQNYYELNPNNPYIRQVAVPKVKKFLKKFPEKTKEKYKES